MDGKGIIRRRNVPFPALIPDAPSRGERDHSFGPLCCQRVRQALAMHCSPPPPLFRPLNDLSLLKSLRTYQNHPGIQKATTRSLEKHLCYLMEELVNISAFDARVPEDKKKDMVEAMMCSEEEDSREETVHRFRDPGRLLLIPAQVGRPPISVPSKAVGSARRVVGYVSLLVDYPATLPASLAEGHLTSLSTTVQRGGGSGSKLQ